MKIAKVSPIFKGGNNQRLKIRDQSQSYQNSQRY